MDLTWWTCTLLVPSGLTSPRKSKPSPTDISHSYVFCRWHTRVSYMRPRSGSTPQLYFWPMMCIKMQCMCLSPRTKKIILWYNLWYYSSLLRRHAWDCNDQLHDCTLRIQFGKKGLHDQNKPMYKRLPLSLQGPATPPCQSFVVAYVYLWPSLKIRLF